MPAILIKDVPVAVHKSLKAQALANRRSLNKEALAILERNLAQRPAPVALDEIDRRRVRLKKPLTGAFIRKAIDRGRA